MKLKKGGWIGYGNRDKKLKSHKSNNILPPLTQEQINSLRTLIERHGFAEPIEITSEYTILDGHNKVNICKVLGINSVSYRIIDVEDELSYILEKDLNWRQLTKESEAYIRGKVYLEEKKKGVKGNQYIESGGGHFAQKRTTSEKLEKLYNVDEKTIRRDEKYADAIDTIEDNTNKDTKVKILAGDLFFFTLITKICK